MEMVLTRGLGFKEKNSTHGAEEHAAVPVLAMVAGFREFDAERAVACQNAGESFPRLGEFTGELEVECGRGLTGESMRDDGRIATQCGCADRCDLERGKCGWWGGDGWIGIGGV